MGSNSIGEIKEGLQQLSPDEALKLVQKTFGSSLESNFKKWIPIPVITLYYVALQFVAEKDIKMQTVAFIIAAIVVCVYPFFSQYKEQRRFWPLGLICFLGWVQYDKPFFPLGNFYDTMILAGCVFLAPIIEYILRPDKEIIYLALSSKLFPFDKIKAMDLLTHYRETNPLQENLTDLVIDNEIKVTHSNDDTIKITRKGWGYSFVIQKITVQTGAYNRLYRIRRNRFKEIIQDMLPNFLSPKGE